ncbi:hypothetical protein BDZ89DRAFT_1154617 [Hymenopellis radicata]|nr:hypothetical protein BDZ89DRAFT_1154617 [Hymenopellis radicata]
MRKQKLTELTWPPTTMSTSFGLQKTPLSLELHEEIIDQLVRSLSTSPSCIADLIFLKAFPAGVAELLGLPMPANTIYALIISLRKDLFNCSLVCKAWVRRTRFHLFSTTQIVSKPLSYSERLISLLSHPNATLKPVVRVLHLASLADCQVARLLQQLPALTEVRLVNIEISSPCVSSPKFPIMTFFPSQNSITALTLFNCQLPALGVFFATLNQCPSLELLVLDRIKFVGAVIPRKRSLSSTLKVGTLRGDDIPLELWQSLHVLCPTLHTVSTGPAYRHRTTRNDLRTLLSHVGTSLEHISIPSIGGRLFHDGTAELIASFGLQYLVNLRSIRFHLFLGGGFGGLLHHVPQMLAQLPCGAQEVVLVVDRAPYTDMNAVADWDAVERILEGKAFREMERFVFLLGKNGTESKGGLEKWAKDRLKNLYGRGVVHVEVD